MLTRRREFFWLLSKIDMGAGVAPSSQCGSLKKHSSRHDTLAGWFCLKQSCFSKQAGFQLRQRVLESDRSYHRRNYTQARGKEHSSIKFTTCPLRAIGLQLLNLKIQQNRMNAVDCAKASFRASIKINNVICIKHTLCFYQCNSLIRPAQPYLCQCINSHTQLHNSQPQHSLYGFVVGSAPQ